MACEQMRETVRQRAQMAKIDRRHAAIGFHIEKRDARWVECGPAIADVDADIVTLRQVPAEPGIDPVVFSIRDEHALCLWTPGL